MSAAYNRLLRPVAEAALQQSAKPLPELAVLVAVLESQNPPPQVPESLLAQAEAEMIAKPDSPLTQILAHFRPFILLYRVANIIVDGVIAESGARLEAGERDKLVDIFTRVRAHQALIKGEPLVPAEMANLVPA